MIPYFINKWQLKLLFIQVLKAEKYIQRFAQEVGFSNILKKGVAIAKGNTPAPDVSVQIEFPPETTEANQ